MMESYLEPAGGSPARLPAGCRRYGKPDLKRFSRSPHYWLFSQTKLRGTECLGNESWWSASSQHSGMR